MVHGHVRENNTTYNSTSYTRPHYREPTQRRGHKDRVNESGISASGRRGVAGAHYKKVKVRGDHASCPLRPTAKREKMASENHEQRENRRSKDAGYKQSGTTRGDLTRRKGVGSTIFPRGGRLGPPFATGCGAASAGRAREQNVAAAVTFCATGDAPPPLNRDKPTRPPRKNWNGHPFRFTEKRGGGSSQESRH